MRWYWRKWMIVAKPLDAQKDWHVQMAKDWNGAYLNGGLNRYFTLNAAEMDKAQYVERWGLCCKFSIVDRATWHEGWV